MSDLIDMAQQREAEFLASAMSQYRLPESHNSYSHCEDCGEPIPEARQKAIKGCTRCVLCQEYAEKGWP